MLQKIHGRTSIKNDGPEAHGLVAFRESEEQGQRGVPGFYQLTREGVDVWGVLMI